MSYVWIIHYSDDFISYNLLLRLELGAVLDPQKGIAYKLGQCQIWGSVVDLDNKVVLDPWVVLGLEEWVESDPWKLGIAYKPGQHQNGLVDLDSTAVPRLQQKQHKRQ